MQMLKEWKTNPPIQAIKPQGDDAEDSVDSCTGLSEEACFVSAALKQKPERKRFCPEIW